MSLELKLAELMERLAANQLETIELLKRVAVALEAANPPAVPTAEPVEDETRAALQTRANYNRDHAAELFGDVLTLVQDSETSAHWVETATGKTVVFTPFGWRVEDDVKEYMQ